MPITAASVQTVSCSLCFPMRVPPRPPFLVAHGDLDTLVVVDDARSFTERLRAFSSSPVVYAELPGGQHSFDFFRSSRFEAVIDGIEAFAAWVRSRDGDQSRSADAERTSLAGS